MNFQGDNGFFSYPPSTPLLPPPPLSPPPPSLVPFINYCAPPPPDAAAVVAPVPSGTTWTPPAAPAPIETTWTPPLLPPPPATATAAAVPIRTTWTERDHRMFMEALVQIPEGTPCWSAVIAQLVPGKTPQDVEEHFRRLQQIIIRALLEQSETWQYPGSAHVQPPAIPTSGAADESLVVHGGVILRPVQSSDAGASSSSSTSNQNRAWTIEEHRSFLRGLQEYGRGRWTAISRNAVKTRTPAQVASHAQKFFLRQQSRSSNKESRRKSIHDIVS